MQEQTFKLGAYFDEFRLIKSHFWIVTENQFYNNQLSKSHAYVTKQVLILLKKGYVLGT